jgi:DNA-binding IscR family transcriptional regulator
LARPAAEVSLADIIRVIEGPLLGVRGERPEHVGYQGAATSLQEVWIALRASERSILDTVTLAHIAAGRLPAKVHALTEDPKAWAAPNR